MRYATIGFLTLFLSSNVFAHVRTVSLKKDELLNVRTALGIATIVQTPDVIQSAVIGDQSGFKVEYLDKAVTIKPLRFAAKTNLYLMTEKERFNVRLQTLNQEVADFVVYIVNRDAKRALSWVQMTKMISGDGISLTLGRLAKSRDGVLLLDGSLSFKRDMKIKADQFWVLQGNDSKVIDSLFLTSLDGKKNGAVRFGVSISLSELEPKKPITLQFRGAKPLSINLAGSEWKR